MPPGSLLAATQAGNAFTADTDLQPLTLLQYIRAKFANPNGSGKICFVYNFGGYTAINGGGFVKVIKGSNQAVTTNNISPSNQNMASNNISVATLTWATAVSPVADGSQYRKLATPANIYNEFKSNIIAIYPGQNVIIEAQAILAGSILMHLDWLELPN